jgi:hypothetical protein
VGGGGGSTTSVAPPAGGVGTGETTAEVASTACAVEAGGAVNVVTTWVGGMELPAVGGVPARAGGSGFVPVASTDTLIPSRSAPPRLNSSTRIHRRLNQPRTALCMDVSAPARNGGYFYNDATVTDGTRAPASGDLGSLP